MTRDVRIYMYRFFCDFSELWEMFSVFAQPQKKSEKNLVNTRL